jgi:hypothetical protein
MGYYLAVQPLSFGILTDPSGQYLRDETGAGLDAENSTNDTVVVRASQRISLNTYHVKTVSTGG